MEKFHAERQEEENERLRERMRQLTVEAEEAAKRSESFRMENQMLRAEQESIDQERKTYQDEILRLQSLVVETHGTIQGQGNTPAGYRRATVSDTDVFIRKHKKNKYDSDSGTEDESLQPVKSRAPSMQKSPEADDKVQEGKRVEMEQLERERSEYQQNMAYMQHFMLNNMVPATGYRRQSTLGPRKATRAHQPSQPSVACETDSKPRTGNDKGCKRPVPAPRKRQTKSSSADKDNKSARSGSDDQGGEESREETHSPEATDTEMADSDMESNLTSKPWQLKREKRIVGKEALQRRLEKPKQKQITPEPFKGDVHLQEYLGQFESCATWNGWNDKQKAQQLFMCLRGRARGVIRQKDEWQKITYQELVGRLEAIFSGQSEVYLAQLRGRQQQPQESVQDFAQAIRKLTDDAYVGMAEEARNRIARDNFMANLRDREIRSAVHLSRPTSMEEAIRTALETEAFLTAEKQKNPAKYTRVVHNDGSEKDAKMSEMLDLLKDAVGVGIGKILVIAAVSNVDRSITSLQIAPRGKIMVQGEEMITRRETTSDPTKEPGAGRRQTNWL